MTDVILKFTPALCPTCGTPPRKMHGVFPCAVSIVPGTDGNVEIQKGRLVADIVVNVGEAIVLACVGNHRWPAVVGEP